MIMFNAPLIVKLKIGKTLSAQQSREQSGIGYSINWVKHYMLLKN